MKKPVTADNASALIDDRIKELGDWRGKMLARVRKLIHDADPKSSDAKRAKKDAKKWGCSWAK